MFSFIYFPFTCDVTAKNEAFVKVVVMSELMKSNMIKPLLEHVESHRGPIVATIHFY